MFFLTRPLCICPLPVGPEAGVCPHWPARVSVAEVEDVRVCVHGQVAVAQGLVGVNGGGRVAGDAGYVHVGGKAPSEAHAEESRSRVFVCLRGFTNAFFTRS